MFKNYIKTALRNLWKKNLFICQYHRLGLGNGGQSPHFTVCTA